MVAETRVAEMEVAESRADAGESPKRTRSCGRVGCDAEFVPNRRDSKYCSPRCAQMVYAGQAGKWLFRPAQTDGSRMEATRSAAIDAPTLRAGSDEQPILSGEIQERIKTRAREIVEQTVRDLVVATMGDLVRQATREAVRQTVREIAAALEE